MRGVGGFLLVVLVLIFGAVLWNDLDGAKYDKFQVKLYKGTEYTVTEVKTGPNNPAIMSAPVLTLDGRTLVFNNNRKEVDVTGLTKFCIESSNTTFDLYYGGKVVRTLRGSTVCITFKQ